MHQMTEQEMRNESSGSADHAAAAAASTIQPITALTPTPASASSSSSPSVPLMRLLIEPNPHAHIPAACIVPRRFDTPRKPVVYEDAWRWFRAMGSPSTICAPMVNQSELAFRLLVHRYDCDVAYTPMLHAEVFCRDAKYRAEYMAQPKDPREDRPLIAQFCANDPNILLKAATYVQHQVDAVDINFGCPQGIAKRGHYGSFLLEESQLLHDLVSTLHQHLSVPVTVKIRRLPSEEATIAMVKMLQEAGASLITIHGRTRQQIKDRVGECDWKIMRCIKRNVSVPVYANGGIGKYEDVERCMRETGVDGVMSSEALLCNPALFSKQHGRDPDRLALAREYMEIIEQLRVTTGYETDQSQIRAHLFKILYQHLCLHIDQRDRLAHCQPHEFNAIISELQQRWDSMDEQTREEKLQRLPVWYHRHQQTPEQAAAAEAKRKAQEEAEAARQQAEDEAMTEGFCMFDEAPALVEQVRA